MMHVPGTTNLTPDPNDKKVAQPTAKAPPPPSATPPAPPAPQGPAPAPQQIPAAPIAKPVSPTTTQPPANHPHTDEQAPLTPPPLPAASAPPRQLTPAPAPRPSAPAPRTGASWGDDRSADYIEWRKRSAESHAVAMLRSFRQSPAGAGVRSAAEGISQAASATSPMSPIEAAESEVGSGRRDPLQPRSPAQEASIRGGRNGISVGVNIVEDAESSANSAGALSYNDERSSASTRYIRAGTTSPTPIPDIDRQSQNILESPGEDSNYVANDRGNWENQKLQNTLVAAGTAPYITNRTLMQLDYWVYREGYIHAGGNSPQGIANDDLKEPHERVPDGFVRLDFAQKESGYYAIALYHPVSNTVIIVNRGTQTGEVPLHGLQFSKDYQAVLSYRRGEVPEQARDAQQFLLDVMKAKDAYAFDKNSKIKSAKWISTGHSLGGAATQVQVAFSRRGNAGVPRIKGVMFAAVGARETIKAMGMAVKEGFDREVDSNIIDYTRIGDGHVLRNANHELPHPAIVGQSYLLQGVRMEEIKALEEALQRAVVLNMIPSPTASIRLQYLYGDNHTVSTFEHRTLDDPVYKPQGDLRQ